MKNIVAKGTLYLMLAELTIVLSGYLIHIGLARLFGPAVYGTFGVILSLILINKTVFLTGANRAVSKFIAEKKENVLGILRSGIYLQLIFIAVSLLIFLAFAPYIAALLRDPSLTPLIRLSALIVLPLGLYITYAKGYLNGEREFKKQAYLDAAYSLFKLIFAFALVYLGFGIFGAVAAYIIAPLVVFFITLRVVRGVEWKVGRLCSSPLSSRSDPGGQPFPKMTLFRFALPITLFYTAFTLSMDFGLLAVKSLLADPNSAGFYTSASSLAKITFSVFTALPFTILPSISAAVAENNERLVKKYIHQFLRYSMMILFPIAVLTSAYASQIISLFYGSPYLAATPALEILVFGFTFFTLFIILHSVIAGAGKPAITMLMSFFVLILSMILCLVLIPSFFIIGAAWAITLTGLVGLIVAAVYTWVKFKALVSFSSVIKITAASAVIYALGRHLAVSGWTFIFFIGLLLLFYLLLLFLFKEIKKEDLELVKGMLKGIIKK